MDWSTILAIIVAICGASGPIALVMAIVQGRNERRRHKDELAKIRFESIKTISCLRYRSRMDSN